MSFFWKQQTVRELGIPGVELLINARVIERAIELQRSPALRALERRIDWRIADAVVRTSTANAVPAPAHAAAAP